MNNFETSNIYNSPLALALMREYGLSAHEITRFIRTAPNRYKEYKIPKKHSTGTRHIANPTASLKVLQRWITDNYLSELPVHCVAMAYEADTSIKKNAEVHTKSRYLMKLDFKDFFPSIKPKDLIELLRKHSRNITAEDKIVLTQLLFWQPKGSDKLQLSIGAPSSPKISNLVMYYFDDTVSKYCAEHDIVYTRFADDLTFSTNEPFILENCLKFVIKTLKDTRSPRLTLNDRKVIFSSKKFNRRVTGLVLTNDGNVSLGHDKKRVIRASIHHFICGKLTSEDSQKLRGTLAYAHAVEPNFIVRMCRKYGHDAIKKIQSYELPKTSV